MRIFHYHPDTGALVGTGLADPSPLEPGVFLIPAFSTTTVPPAAIPGKRRTWDGQKWIQVDIEIPKPNESSSSGNAEYAPLTPRERFEFRTGITIAQLKALLT
jgi:hypothetical protein